jgi:membrane peptidoglycan carboxypeptidase
VNHFFETGKKAREKRRPGPLLYVLRTLFNLFLILGLCGVVGVAALYLSVVERYDASLSRKHPLLVQDSYVYDRQGERIGVLEAPESRETVGLDGMGDHLPAAVVAIEDRRFYEHFGVDFEGLGRAAWTDLRAWEVQEGGSTISEQLMKNLFVDEDERLEVSFWRRFVQSSLAFSYERRHTKEEILTAYLNTVYYGDGAYGAERAARRYFGKSAEDVTLSEAAALAGFLHAPSTYTTWEGEPLEEAATARRDEVLRLMREQGMISLPEYAIAVSSELDFAPAPPPEDPDYAPFLERVERELAADVGPDAVRLGGLRVYTTVDPDLQKAAVEESAEVLSNEDDPSAAVVTVEPQSGALRALSGKEGDFNLALHARRQPGSSFKPFVLAAALKQNVSPYSVYVSQDLNFSFQDEYYAIENYDSVERGPISISEAMAESDNTVFVQLAADVGLERVASMARQLGINTPVEAYPSTAIGGLGAGVSPLDMASAYSTFAAAGLRREPYSIGRVQRSDYGRTKTAFEHRVGGRRVLTSNEAAIVSNVLRGVVLDGTASMYHDLDEEIGRPSAGKTGTTDDFVDAWYVGYTPRLCTSVWVGYPEGSRSMVGVHGLEEPNGERLPMDIWSSYMARATEDDIPLGFATGDTSGLTVSYGG